MRRARRLRTGWALVLLAVLALIVLGPVFAPHSPTATVGPPFRPPDSGHLLGTDVVGRDVLSRVLHGGLPLLSIAVASLVSAYALGLGLGLLAGLRRGADRWIMRPVDVIVVIPWFLLLAVIATALGAGPLAIVVTAALASVPWIVRIIRTCVHDLASAGYVEAARGRREPLWRIALIEVLPNLRAVVAADAGVRFAGVISIVAVGGFLGLGLRPPSPDWALMITENRPGFGIQPWSVLAPALLVMLLVVPVNMLGDRALGRPRRGSKVLGTDTITSGPDTADAGSGNLGAGTGGALTGGAFSGDSRTGDAGTSAVGFADTRADAVCVTHLTVRTERGVTVLDDVSVRVAPGAGLAVIGPSGAGKTTLVSAVLGALPHGWTTEGMVAFGTAGRRRRRVGFVPQDPATGLNPALRIGVAIDEIARLCAGSDADRAEVVGAALRRVGLPDDREFRRRFPHQISGGQQQRVLVAMALLGDPAVVVLDEPTTGLDRRTRTELIDTLVELRRESGTAFVVVTHDLPAVAPLVDDVLELDAGRVMSYAPTTPATGGPSRVDTGVVGHTADGAHARPARERATDQPILLRPLPTDVSPKPILRVDNLTIAHPGRRIVTGLSFTLAAGTCLAITGRSGSGKTTLARAVAGLHPPLGGVLLLDDDPLSPIVEQRSIEHCRAVQLVAQNPAGSLNPSHRVGSQIARPLRLLRGMDSARATRETARLLTAVRLDPELAARRPAELSGGQQQRVAIARALAADPRVLICDEITASLDDESQTVIIELLDRLRRDGLALVLISHQETVLARLADRVLGLDDPAAATAN